MIQSSRKMLQTALLRRKVTIQSSNVKTPHISSMTATGGGGRSVEPACADGPLQEGEPPPEEAVGGEGDHAEGVAGFELEDAGDELGDSAVGEGQGHDDGDGPGGRRPALIQLRTTVVRPKPARPSGAGFAGFVAVTGVVTSRSVGFAIVLDCSCSLCWLEGSEMRPHRRPFV